MAPERTAALTDIDAVLNHRPADGGSAGVAEMAAMLKACIERWAPPGSSYRRMADAVNPLEVQHVEGNLRADLRLRGVLVTMERDYRAGMSRTLDERVHAAILDDADRPGRPPPGRRQCSAAAIVIGAALEQHLRQLAARLDVAFEIPDARGVLRAKPAHRLNDDLRLMPAYPHAEWDQIKRWLHAREQAAQRLCSRTTSGRWNRSCVRWRWACATSSAATRRENHPVQRPPRRSFRRGRSGSSAAGARILGLVELAHHPAGVGVARVRGRVQLGDVVGAEHDLGGADVLGQALVGARRDDHARHHRLQQQPRERDLRRRGAMALGDAAQDVDDRVAALDDRTARSDRPRRSACRPRAGACDRTCR